MTSPDTCQAGLEALLHRHELPSTYLNAIEHFHLPLASMLAERHRQSQRAHIWGICGSQGSGKSTLVQFLAHLLQHRFGLHTLCLSLDDFYLGRQERSRLSRLIHPLFATRGVPGTHDVSLGITTLAQLKRRTPHGRIAIPQFDKSRDDPLPRSAWHSVRSTFDIILFEGWCVGSRPQSEAELGHPLNELERTEDPSGIWRKTVNHHLHSDYAAWWELLEGLVFLRVPGFEQVHRWRALQEDKLRRQFLRRGEPVPPQVMSADQIQRFIQHYERLTRWNLDILPSHSDVVLDLQEDHQFCGLHFYDTQSAHR
ncbi:MAG: phosphoribulokinase [Hahellaceae bacterium]|nr:phosphoribulokinase [Hahellaceae bacterium]